MDFNVETINYCPTSDKKEVFQSSSSFFCVYMLIVNFFIKGESNPPQF